LKLKCIKDLHNIISHSTTAHLLIPVVSYYSYQGAIV